MWRDGEESDLGLSGFGDRPVAMTSVPSTLRVLRPLLDLGKVASHF